jgi:hypothetical protein
VIQQFMPSLHAPKGNVFAPVETVPIGVGSVAFQSDTLFPVMFVTKMRWPSKAA